VASGAKDAANSVADGVADAAPNSVVSGAKDAARSVADAAPSPGEAVDGARQGLRDASLTPDSPREALASAKDAADSAKQGAKDVVSSAQVLFWVHCVGVALFSVSKKYSTVCFEKPPEWPVGTQ